jgi:protein involved in polysaccharide export with SLBB domain
MDGIRNGSKVKANNPGSRCKKSRFRTRITGKTGSLLFDVSILLFLALSSGCGSKFFDPTQVGRFRPVPAVNVILDSLGVAEETPVAWEQAEEPLPVDTMAVESDYVFRAGDIISVAIFELLQEGVQFVNNYVVTETGRISIPEVGVIEAAGLTETQLEAEIKQILSPGILKNPSVIVTLAGSQQRAFSILGDGVLIPGRYPIPRYNFRLADALATAGGARQFNVSYIYVSRSVGDNNETKYEPLKPGVDGLELKVIEPETANPVQNMGQIGQPRVQHQWPASKVVIASSEMAADWESAGIPKAFEWPSNPTPRRVNGQSERKSSTEPDAPERKKEPVSVKDILETLNERSRREQEWLSGRIEVENAMASFRELVRLEGGANERINRRSPQRLSPEPGRTETMDEPASVDEILKTLDERSRQRQGGFNGRAGDIENSRESVQRRGRSQNRMDERINRRDTTSLSDALVAPKPMREPLNKEEPGRIKWVFQGGRWIPIPVQNDSPQPTEDKEQGGHIEWIFRNGKWVPVRVGPEQQPQMPKPIEPLQPVIKIEPGEEMVGPLAEPALPGLEPEEGAMTRLIRIPADKLLAGDPRYNVVIKPGDTIFVPVDSVGEFYIMGNVNRTGPIPITGRPMTLKMAIAVAGGLNPIAWPKRCEVVRRIGRETEEIVMVDLDKIASGEQPDFFIKPNDLINVGTHPTSRWRAILRNAFRATYGFGFVYDRNFADRDFGTHRPFPGWL